MFASRTRLLYSRPLRWVSFLALLGVVLLQTPQSSLAQNSTSLMATYGKGVHAYFKGQVHEADRLLSEVINGGSTDPRVFYFRAMARMRAGRTYEAEFDMQVGAAYEAQNPGYGSTVSRALERVQGPNRRKLEEFRRKARLEHLSEQRMKNRTRYEQLKRREPKVLRKAVEVPLEQLTNPNGAEISSPARPVPVVPPSPTNLGDPFGATEERDDDPFGSLEKPEEPDAEDPFGSPANDQEDPFGDPDSDTDDGGFFSDQRPDAADDFASESSPPTGLAESDKVPASKVAGVVGGVASKVLADLNPFKGFSLSFPIGPGMGPGPGAEFGPGNEFGATEFGADEGFGPSEGFGDDMEGADGGDPFIDDSSDDDFDFGAGDDPAGEDDLPF